MKTNTKANLAKTLEISTGHLSDLLSGRRSAGYPLAKKIADTTGISAEIWLRGGGTSYDRKTAIKSWEQETTQPI